LADLFSGKDKSDEDDSLLRIAPRTSGAFSDLLEVLSPPMRAAVEMELEELTLLQQRPVMLTSPVTFVVR
jgi:hypothetical protein